MNIIPMQFNLQRRNNMNKAIVLGGTAAHIARIEELHKRGFYVILVDYLDNPPAKKSADIHIQESTMDFDAVLKIAAENKVGLVISSSVDQANITATFVNEKLGLTNPYSYETACAIADKSVMKKVMMRAGRPTTKYHCFERDESLHGADLDFPVIVKPVDSCAASGVKKANNESELSLFFDNARKISRSGKVIVEEYFEGVEVSAYCFISNKKAKIIMISERLSVIDGEKQVLKCYATITPPNISEVAIQKIEDAATEIAKAFNIDNSPFHIQALVNQNDIDIIEFAPRVGGGISFKTIKMNTGFDIIAATVDSYLNIPVQVPLVRAKHFYAVNIVYANPGVFSSLQLDDSLFSNGFIESIYYHKTPGMMVTDEKASGGRIAAFITKGESRKDIIEKTAYVFEHMDVLDEHGRSIIRKDLRIMK